MRSLQKALEDLWSPKKPEDAPRYRTIYHEVANDRHLESMLKAVSVKCMSERPGDMGFVMLTIFWLGIVTGFLMHHDAKGHVQ